MLLLPLNKAGSTHGYMMNVYRNWAAELQVKVTWHLSRDGTIMGLRKMEFDIVDRYYLLLD
jgi:hypothetical protein